MCDAQSLSAAIKAAWKRGDREKGARLAGRLARDHPGDGEALHLAAGAALESGDAARVQDLMDRALRTDPPKAIYWNKRGRALAQFGRHPEATESYGRASKLDSTLLYARFNRAVARNAAGDGYGAVEELRGFSGHPACAGYAVAYLVDLLRETGKLDEALDRLADALVRDDGDPALTSAFADLIKLRPHAMTEKAAALLPRLIRHPRIVPQDLTSAGWLALIRSDEIGAQMRAAEAADDGLLPLAAALEAHPFALDAIGQTLPAFCPVELCLTRVRAMLLLSGRDTDFRCLTAALNEQCALNGGAWPVTGAKALALLGASDRPIRSAYPEARTTQARGDQTPIRAQYEAHPYPVWRRLTQRPLRSLAAFRSGAGLSAKPASARPRILVAGCGTGRHAARLASGIRNANVTAIDISVQSLDFAQQQTGELGLTKITFHQMDILDLATWGDQFDHIEYAGVLHHMDGTVAGWRALTQVLAPGGTMRIGLYSRHAREGLQRARDHLAGIEGTDDAALRQARARLLAAPAEAPFALAWRLTDFCSLQGFRDLLFNAHEELFDLERTQAILGELGLEFWGCDPVNRAARVRKEVLFPPGGGMDELAEWAELEKIYPETSVEAYQFWCVPKRGVLARTHG